MNLRQFFTLLRQQRLFSGIYITCTALSTALTMTLFLVVYIMFGPVYPEQERGRMAILQAVYYNMGEGRAVSTSANAELADSLRKMPEVEVLCTINNMSSQSVLASNSEAITCRTQLVDKEYWQVFGFRFIHGRGFEHSECQANSPVCVITEGLARKVFGQTNVVGRTLKTSSSDIIDIHSDSLLHVVGVVEDASIATPMTYVQLWLPNDNSLEPNSMGYRFFGRRMLVMLLRKGTTVEQLQTNVARMEENVNHELAASGLDRQLCLYGQPDIHWKSCFRRNHTVNAEPFLRRVLGLLLAFLLIPAMNMSSMVASRVNARTNEMGIRRAYGATRTGLLWQVLQENFMLTLIGSLLGLVISWIIMVLGADWLPFILAKNRIQDLTIPVQIHVDMLVSGWIMAAMLTANLVLNLVSALVPTMWILRRRVTEEINQKR